MKSMLKKVVGIQMEGVLEWLRRLRCCAHLDRLILSAIMLSLWSNVSAAQTSGTFECDQECPKTRELVTTVWGGVVTLFVLSFDSWGTLKALMVNDETDKILEWITLLIWTILNPVAMLFRLVECAAWSYHMRRRMPGFTVLSLLLPWTKHPAKILCGCQDVIIVPTLISIPCNFIEPDLLVVPSEAVVIGRGQEESRETRNISLNFHGIGVLLQMDALPPYDQLKVLQGNFGLATVISTVQSMGYIYGVVVRTIQGLPVSPIEVVALMLSILILIKALLHNLVSTCHRPLHVYLTDEQAQTFVETCEKYTTLEVPKRQIVGPMVVIVLLISSVVIYYIVHMWQTTRIIMVVPIMLSLVGFYLQLRGFIQRGKEGYVIIIIMSVIKNAMSYILALVVTIEYWKVDRLNAKTSSMLAQILPYIG